MSWIRHLRLSWVIGLAILTASLLGANHIMNAPREGDPPKVGAPALDRGANRTPTRTGGVSCTGSFVPENERIPLAPSAMGEVLKVFVKDDQKVKKGDSLLQLDDRLAKSKLARADAGVRGADGLVREAKVALLRYELEVEGQKEVISAKQYELAAAQKRLAKAENLVKGGVVTTTEDVDSGKLLIKALEAGIRGEQIKLKAIEISKPDNKLSQAEANLEAAKSQQDEAKMGVEACLMTAPDDGTIMKVSVGVGAKFGPHIQQPAFWFYTGKLSIRAQVEQDYANRIKEGQTATVYEIGPGKGKSWTGKVTNVASSFQPKRDPTAIPDLFQQSQESVLECRITLDEGQELPRQNQKVRIHIGGN